MKTRDDVLLEHAYQQITLNKQLHQAFLTEAGLLNKAKQAGEAIMDKARGLLGSSVAGLLEIIRKANPELFAKIQRAVQQQDEQTLQAIFKDPEVKQQQQQLAQESLLGEGVADHIKNFYNKANNFVTERPELASKLALAGILAAMTAAGPEGLSHIAGFLAQVGGKALGGAVAGGAIGGAVGAYRGGWEGAKKGMAKGATIGAAAGIASGTQDVMAHGASSIEDVISNLASAVSPDEAQQLAALKNRIASAKLSPEDTKDILDTLNDKSPTKEKIEFVNDLLSGQETLAASQKNIISQDGLSDLSKGAASMSNDIAAGAEQDAEAMFKRIDKLNNAVNDQLEKNSAMGKQLDQLLKSLGLRE